MSKLIAPIPATNLPRPKREATAHAQFHLGPWRRARRLQEPQR